MATEKEASCQSCASDPNFAIICSFLERFASTCGIIHPTFSELQKMIEDSQEDVPQALVDLHVKLLRKARKSVTTEKWERALIKFCHSYSNEDGWELERTGYKKSKVAVKLRLLKSLLDSQFDFNVKFKTDINKLTAEELRLEPLGKDKAGQQYWCQFDPASNIRVYKEDTDEESWDLVAEDREGLVSLISQLSSDEELIAAISTNEDSSSQEIEKPITDTGQQLNSNGASDEDSNIDTSKVTLDTESIPIKNVDEEIVDSLVEGKVNQDSLSCDKDKSEVLNSERIVESTSQLETEKSDNVDENKVDIKDCDKEGSKFIGLSEIGVDTEPEGKVLKSSVDSIPSVKTEPVSSSDSNDKTSQAKDSVKSAEIIKLKIPLVAKSILGDSIKDEMEKGIKEENVLTKSSNNEVVNEGRLFKTDDVEKSIEKIDNKAACLGMESSRNIESSESLSHSTASSESLSHSVAMNNVKLETPTNLEKKDNVGKSFTEQTLLFKSKSSHKESFNMDEKISDLRKQSSVSSVNIDSCVDLSNKKPVACLDKSIDVAEELKQRGALLKTNAPHFRGKGNSKNAPGSKLDQIFSFKRGLDLTKPPESQPLRAHFVGSGQSQFGNQILDKIKLGSLISPPNISDSGNYQTSDAHNLSTKRQVEDLSMGGEKRRIPEDLTVHPKKKAHIQESSNVEVSEAIEEPMMLVKGEGSGKECETENTNRDIVQSEVSEIIPSRDEGLQKHKRIPDSEENDVEVSEAIEEPIMIIVGEGSGKECETGNPGDEGNNVNIDEKSHTGDSVGGERSTESNVNSSEITNPVCEIDKKSSSLWSIDNICTPALSNEKNKLTLNDVSNAHQEKSNSVSNCSGDLNSLPSVSLDNTTQSNVKIESEKSLRRKSLDNSNIEDKDTNPPLPKKTKVVSESSEVSEPSESVNEETPKPQIEGTNIESGNQLSPTEHDVIKIQSENNESKNKMTKTETNKYKKSDTNVISETKGSESLLGLTPEKQDEVKKPKDSKKGKKLDCKPERKTKGSSTTNFEQSNHVTAVGNVFISDQTASVKANSVIPDLKDEETVDNVKTFNTQNTSDVDSAEEDNSEPVISADGDDTSSEFKGFVPTELPSKGNSCLSRIIENTDKYTTLNSLSESNDTISNSKNIGLEELPKVGIKLTEEKSNNSKINNNSTFPSVEDTSKGKISIKLGTERKKLNDSSDNKSCDSSKNKESYSVDSKISLKSKNKPITIKEDEVKIVPRTRSRRSSVQTQPEITAEESNKEDVDVNMKTDGPTHKGNKKITKNKKNLTQKSESARLTNTEIENTKEDLSTELLDSNETHNKVNKTGGKKNTKGKSTKTKNEIKEDTEVNLSAKAGKKTPARGTRSSRRVNNILSDTPLPDLTAEKVENKSDTQDLNETDKNDVDEPNDETTTLEDIGDSNAKNESKSNKNSKSKAKELVSISNRKRRSSKRVGEKDSNDESENVDKEEIKSDEEEGAGGKRRKVKGKRSANKALRRSIEVKRDEILSSEEETPNKADTNEDATEISPDEIKESVKIPKKKGRPKKGTTVESSATKKAKSSSPEKFSRVLLGLDISDMPDETETFSGRLSRHSSRIAQIKIREQAERREIEEAKFLSLQEQRKRKKAKIKEEKRNSKLSSKHKKKKETDETFTLDKPTEPAESKKKKRKRKDPVRSFNEGNPWRSSSESSSSMEEEEEEEHDIEEEEDLIFKSDHEFSPESDLENDVSYVPVRRARTAQKDPSSEEAQDENDSDEYACQKCENSDHPEWILLCDKCDKGWHASCLRPTLFLIPEGDWFCPPCSHVMLVEQLQNKLSEFDKDSKRRDNEELRRKRLAYVGISLDNVLPSGGHPPGAGQEQESSSSSDSEESESESSSYDSEPVYQLRQRRQNVISYKFNEFDELINSAIQDEIEGKMAFKEYKQPKIESKEDAKDFKPEGNENIEKKDKSDEKADIKTEKEPDDKVENSDKKKESKSDDDYSHEEDEDDEEEEGYIPRVVPKKTSWPRMRKKTRRLNCLDDQSDDDGSDEDFKGSSFDEEEEDDFDAVDSDDSGGYRGRSKRGRQEPVRRSSRTRTSRFDKEFINDDSDESDAPRRKKTRHVWVESESESDETWGRRKKKNSIPSFKSKRRSKHGRRKPTIEDDSENDSPKVPKKKRQRKIKYGGLDDLNVEELPSRRTRGCKINYQEVLGSDTEEEILNPKTKSKKLPSGDEDEFVLNKDEENESGEEEDDDEAANDLENGDSSENSEKEDEKNGENVNEKKEEKTEKKEEKDETESTILKKVIKVESPKGPRKKQVPKIEEDNVASRDKMKEVKEKLNAHLEAHKTKAFPVKFGNNVSKFPKSHSAESPKYMIVPPPTPLMQDDSFGSTKISTIPTPVVRAESNLKQNTFSMDQPHEIKKEINESEQFAVNYVNKSSKNLEGEERPPSLPISSALESKLANRNPPIKIRSGVPVNAGRKSPIISNPNAESSEKIMSGLITSISKKPINNINIKSEFQRRPLSEEELSEEEDEDDYEDLLEEEEEDEIDEERLEEGEIPRRIAAQMKKVEEQLRKQNERDIKLKEIKSEPGIEPGTGSSNLPPGSSNNSATKPPVTQPTTPMLRVVSPLKLMANPPGPLQSTFMHASPKMPLTVPQQRMPMIPQQRPPLSIPPMGVLGDGPSSPKRKGRGRGKKQIAQEQATQEQSLPQDPVTGGSGSVIRGMLQAPQSFSPTKFQQQYPTQPHPRMPFNPAMAHRLQRPPNAVYHSGHHPLDPSPSGGGPIAVQPNIKQEPGTISLVPTSTPGSSPNKPPMNASLNYLRPPGPPPLRYPSDSSSPRHPHSMPFPPPHGNQLPPRPQGGYGGYPPPQPPPHLPSPAPPHVPPPPPSNYHYGNYNTPVGGDDVPPSSYQGSSYPEPYVEPNAPVVETSNSKSYDDEGSGEFGGLVSYFSSQREDDIDT